MTKKVAFDPSQSILSPLWIFALGILIVNDHFLKAAWGNAFTGKFSDFAGLFLAPVLLAFILGVKTKRGLRLSGIAIGFVFAMINVFPSAALLWDNALSLVYPYSTTVDPTDLIALIMIPLGISVFSSSVSSFSVIVSKNRNRFASRGMALVGLGASLASTTPPDEQFVPMESSIVSIYNQSNELHILRIRNLELGFSLDCDVVLKTPAAYLSPEFFGDPTEWLLQSGQQIPIRPLLDGRRCDAALVESETLPDVIVFWKDDLLVKSFPFDFDIPRSIPADPQTLVIQADYPEGAEDFHEWRFRTECGSRADFCNRETLAVAAEVPPGTSYFWESDSEIGPLHHIKPSSLDRRRPDPSAECSAPTAEVGVFWEDGFAGLNGNLRVVDIREGLDGCHDIFMRRDTSDEEISLLICVPFETISTLKPTSDLPAVELSFTEEVAESSIFLLIRAVYYDDNDAQNFVTVKSIHVSKGGLPHSASFPFQERPRLDCVPLIQSCGVSLPLDLEVDGQILKPGESTIFGTVIEREIHLIRSEYLPISAEICGAFEQNNIYLETVIITE